MAGLGIRGRGLIGLRLVLGAALLVAAASASGHAAAAAATTQDVWVQAMNPCYHAIPDAIFQLKDSSGTLVAQTALSTGTPGPVGPTGCPAQRGNCSLPTNTGCVTLAVPIPPAPATGTASVNYSIIQTAWRAGHIPCNGGSVCAVPPPAEVANLTISTSSLGVVTVQAQVTNTNPDGSPTTLPMDAAGLYYSGAPADPVLFHDYTLGPGICDGDGDLDDQLWSQGGNPILTCDNDSDRPTTLSVSGVGTNGSLYSGPNFNALASQGGVLIGSPAVIHNVTPNPPAVAYIGTGTDHSLWVRSDSAPWQQLSPTAPPYCLGGPAAYVSPANKLWVACRGSDNALWYATGTGPTTAGALPSVGSWSSLGGILSASPAIAGGGPATSSAEIPTFVVLGADGTLWLRTVPTAYLHLGGRCLGHPAAALGDTANTAAPKTFIACAGTDYNLWYGFYQSGTFHGFFSAMATVASGNGYTSGPSGGITDGPAIAGTATGAIFLVTGAGDLGIYVKTISATQVSFYQRFGLQYGLYRLAYGPGAAG